MDKPSERWSVGEMTERFMQLDYMTQRTIENEFPEFFGVRHVKVDYNSTEHFPIRKFDMNEFYGGFVIVLFSIGILGKILPIILGWIF